VVRNAILTVALLFIVAFGYATLRVAIDDGPDVLTAIALLVLALFAFGIVGALLHPPSE
jgi:hypothetical protein